jgi:hypothetical protein
MHLGQKTPDPMPFRIRRVPQSAEPKAGARCCGLGDSCRKASFKGSVAQSSQHRAPGWLLIQASEKRSMSLWVSTSKQCKQHKVIMETQQ